MLLAAFAGTTIIFNNVAFNNSKATTNNNRQRIISLSPSITETLFALGLGNMVVGRTRFCNYPPETKKIKSVGGYIDPNYEAILALTPDVVILLPEQEKIKNYLQQLGIHSFQVNNKSVNDILNTIKTIGDSCGAQKKAETLITELTAEINHIKAKTKGTKKPKVLISIGRTFGTGSLKDIYVAGEKTYFGELVSIAGGENAIKANSPTAFPMLSAEGIIHLNPDIIIELVPDLKKLSVSEMDIINEWKRLNNVKAVKNNRIKIIQNDYVVIPGPRFVLLLKDFAKIIHPEIDWKN